MSNSNEIFLHIGLHKTATTYLQHSIFPQIEGIDYKGRELELSRLYQNRGNILISNEGMSGCPYVLYDIHYFEQFKKSVRLLLDMFDSAKIIICFREPASFIESCYKQYLHEGGTLKWEVFFSLDKDSSLRNEDFYFSKYVSFLKENIQSECLFIYDFETFKRESEVVVNEISRFITGKNYSGEMPKSKRSNSSVPLSLESSLITLNKWFGNKINLNIFGKRVNQRTMLQTLIPRLINFKKRRNIDDIKNYYAMDYRETKKLISELNPALYEKVNAHNNLNR